MEKENNVIDLASRMPSPKISERLKHLKVRFDLEHARIALPASLLSIILLVTVANSSLMSQPKVVSQDFASTADRAGRKIASVSTGTSSSEDQLVKRLSKSALSDAALVGRRPSSLDNLSLGLLEGKYAVRLQDGKLREIEFADGGSEGDRPKHIEDRAAFLRENAELMPAAFEKSVKVESSKDGTALAETYHLVDGFSIPVAKVHFRMDSAGRLLSMQVSQVQIASK